MKFTLNKNTLLNIVRNKETPQERYPTVDIEGTIKNVFYIIEGKTPILNINEAAFLFNTWLNFAHDKFEIVSMLHGFHNDLADIMNSEDIDDAEIVETVFTKCNDLESLMIYVLTDFFVMSPLNHNSEASQELAESQMKNRVYN